LTRVSFKSLKDSSSPDVDIYFMFHTRYIRPRRISRWINLQHTSDVIPRLLGTATQCSILLPTM
jgi:hypothetical protein